MNIYFDNAATSWPKPPEVIEAVNDFLTHCGGSTGRSAHAFALRAAREVYETRTLIASLFNCPSSDRVIFTSNATHAINLALKGLLAHGDHVITSNIEHNAIIRPLRYLEEKKGLNISVIPFDIETIQKNITPQTKMLVCTHASNVTGQVLPIKDIGNICKKNNILFMVDASQTAGFLSVDMQEAHIDLLAITAHKKLLGTTGIGCLCIKDKLSLESFIQGGTGSLSESQWQPDFYPDNLEAGTLNTVGIVALKAGIKYIEEISLEKIRDKLLPLMAYLFEELKKIEAVKMYSYFDPKSFVPIISFNVKGIMPSDLTYVLDKNYGIMSRAGLHCAPLVHENLGTIPQGCLRISLSIFNTFDEIKYFLKSLKKIIENENC